MVWRWVLTAFVPFVWGLGFFLSVMWGVADLFDPDIDHDRRIYIGSAISIVVALGIPLWLWRSQPLTCACVVLWMVAIILLTLLTVPAYTALLWRVPMLTILALFGFLVVRKYL